MHRYHAIVAILSAGILAFSCQQSSTSLSPRERISINEGWKFYKYPSNLTDELIYDVRPEVKDAKDDREADAKPTEAEKIEATREVLKPMILPTGNRFMKDTSAWYQRPEGDPGAGFPFVQGNFNDSTWESVDLPHDWAINGPFYEGWDAEVGGGMGRLPSPGVAWYRRKIDITEADKGKSIFLDIDGAMSYAMVWINGYLAGGWPYGYSSFRIDLTPYLNHGGENRLAIRLDNPNNSSRWYPGGGIYRNVWLVKNNPVHVAQWGTFVSTTEASPASAQLALATTIDNDSETAQTVNVTTEIYPIDSQGEISGEAVTEKDIASLTIPAKGSKKTEFSLTIDNPQLWGPPPTQAPNQYLAKTTVSKDGEILDQYDTPFGIRQIAWDGNEGLFVNGEKIFIKGVNQHHDLGALGAAFNVRAAERQLEILAEMGCNAIRLAHNPPAPELLDLTDKMGFLVVDELYDCWERKKTPLDFHLIFPEWHEQDLRSLIRRDKNHPSVILWSTGNEVGEQYTDADGAAVARRLREIANDEDPTRPTSASMNYAQAHMPMPAEMEVINLNYQGEGIRDAKEYVHLRKGRITTTPAYPMFHEQFPEKVIISSENAAALSTRGTYIFPVHPAMSAPVSDTTGGDPDNQFVSAYELYTAQFGSSADKVFRSVDQHPYVAGGFVWSGWDYIGEPTPYYSARSSYYGMIDLAGFKKDRFYLYQSRWRPDLPMAHILPHWNWPERVGEVTPVHVFTSGDEAELFLNGKSLGRKKKGDYEYRLRWDDVVYEPGELKVIAYLEGEKWAEETVKTTGEASALRATTDRSTIQSDGADLAFVTVEITDAEGLLVANANNKLKFTLEGPGEIVATDNGDPRDLTSFASTGRNAFNGLCLVIVKAKKGQAGTITVSASSGDLSSGNVDISVIDK